MKKTPEQPEKGKNSSRVESWSKEMHNRFVPDPGVVPIGRTLSLAQRIQRKAEPHALTQSLMNRYVTRRQAGVGSSGDMPFRASFRPDHASVPVVQGVVRDSFVLQKKDAVPVTPGHVVTASAGKTRPEAEALSSETGTEQASHDTSGSPVREVPPMVPSAVAFVQGLNQGKSSLVQRALDRSQGKPGLVKAPVKTVINPKSSPPVVQAKSLAGSPELSQATGPSQGIAGDSSVNQTGEASEMLRDSKVAMPVVEARMADSTQKNDAPIPVLSNKSAPSATVPVNTTIQKKAEKQIKGSVTPRKESRDSSRSVPQDLPVSNPNHARQAKQISRTPLELKDSPSSVPPIQGRPTGPKDIPVVQAKKQGMSSQINTPVVHSQAESGGAEPSHEPMRTATHIDVSKPRVEPGELPVQRKVLESPSMSEITGEANHPPAVHAVSQSERQSMNSPETPLVYTNGATERKTEEFSGPSPVMAQAMDHADSSVSVTKTLQSQSPEASPNLQMPVVKAIQPGSEKPTPGRASFMASASQVQAKLQPGGSPAPVIQAQRADGGFPAAQKVRVPDIRQDQGLDFGPMPMLRANTGDIKQTSEPNAPIQRQSEDDARARQGPSTPSMTASQPSPVSVDPMSPPSMEGDTMANLQEIAERVYEMLMERLSIERESLGL